MSMDEVMLTMRTFEEQLELFNERLMQSMAELQEHHAVVSPLWQDEMRREYDIKWLPLEEAMERYQTIIGPSYIEVLLIKMRHLREYLHGSY
jgi:uncharacterized protein YukE